MIIETGDGRLFTKVAVINRVRGILRVATASRSKSDSKYIIPKRDIRRTILTQAFSGSLLHLFFRSVVLDKPSAWTAVLTKSRARAEFPEGLREGESYCQIFRVEILK